ncbi:hypothetical protein, partial [Paenibacillus timonensis]|uniref:hypothetical protein n=1 Tax=Paenibacillus timonensis TaxID=225915 RepID=UPI003F96F1B5
MKRRIVPVKRVIAAVMLLSMLFSAGYVPIQPAKAEPTPDINVFAAPRVTASAIGEVAGGFAPSQAIDGDAANSKWAYEGDTQKPDVQDPYWLKIDTGAEATVRKFV